MPDLFGGEDAPNPEPPKADARPGKKPRARGKRPDEAVKPSTTTSYPRAEGAPYVLEEHLASCRAEAEQLRCARYERWGVDPTAPDRDEQVRAKRHALVHDPAHIAKCNEEIAKNKADHASRKASPRPRERLARARAELGLDRPRAATSDGRTLGSSAGKFVARPARSSATTEVQQRPLSAFDDC